jgi:general secretion pathway protein N
MKSRFSHLLTMALAGACGVLLLLLVLFQFGAGRGYRWWPAAAADALAPNDQLDRSMFKLPAWSEFADVNTRPLFNEDRKPTPPAPPVAPGGEAKPVPKLNVTLSGVVITPKVRIAMIVENGKAAQSSAIREGHALPGELGAWSLTKVKPRGATFKSSAGEELELELIAKGNGLKPPPPAAPAASAPPVVPASAPTEGEAKPGQNTELQQRIEARRKQLQEQADKAKQQGNPPPAEQQHEL